MEINFNPKNLKTVPIIDIKPNPWNPKDKDTEDYKKIKQSIELKGQRLPIIVREKGNRYEVIDGEQRYTACKELGFQEVIIYNEGKMSDDEAKELTIWYQQQVPFNEVMLANLITEIVSNNPNYELPYTPEQIEDFKNMVDFDWDEFEEKDVPETDLKETFTFSFDKEQADIILEALMKAKGDDDVDDNEALLRICQIYTKM